MNSFLKTYAYFVAMLLAVWIAASLVHEARNQGMRHAHVDDMQAIE
jgi:hypothetical protein